MFLMNDSHQCCVCAVAPLAYRPRGEATLRVRCPSMLTRGGGCSAASYIWQISSRRMNRIYLALAIAVAGMYPLPNYALVLQYPPLTTVPGESDLTGGFWTQSGWSYQDSVGVELTLGSQTCKLVPQFPGSTGWTYRELGANNFAIAIDEARRRLLNRTLTASSAESNPSTACEAIVEARRVDRASLVITGKDKYQVHYWLSAVPTVPGRPVTCSSKTSPLDFGRVNIHEGGATADARIITTCSSDAYVAVTVNNNKPYTDTGSGATISFTIPNSVRERCNVCSTTVHGTMLTAPKIPGRYTWAVPVTIDYE